MSIRHRGKHAWQVRVSPFPAQTVPTKRAAEELELRLKLKRAVGDIYAERPATLGEEIDALLARVRASGRSDRTVEFNERSAKQWEPLRRRKVETLRRREIEDFITRRAAVRPRSAKNELEFLKRVLREARERGQRVIGQFLRSGR